MVPRVISSAATAGEVDDALVAAQNRPPLLVNLVCGNNAVLFWRLSRLLGFKDSITKFEFFATATLG